MLLRDQILDVLGRHGALEVDALLARMDCADEVRVRDVLQSMASQGIVAACGEAVSIAPWIRPPALSAPLQRAAPKPRAADPIPEDDEPQDDEPVPAALPVPVLRRGPKTALPGTMSRAVLEYIKAHPGTLSGSIWREVDAKERSCSQILASLMRAGLIEREGEKRQYSYRATA